MVHAGNFQIVENSFFLWACCGPQVVVNIYLKHIRINKVEIGEEQARRTDFLLTPGNSVQEPR